MNFLSKLKASPLNTTISNQDIVSNLSQYTIDAASYKILSLPSDYSVLEHYDLEPARAQGKCGSCWAFATVSCLEDRFKIYSGGKFKKRLSVSKLVLCDYVSEGQIKDNMSSAPDLNSAGISQFACYGNTTLAAFRFLYAFGTVEENCIPYTLDEVTDSYQLPFCDSVSGRYEDLCYDYTIRATSEQFGRLSRYYRAAAIYQVPAEEKYIMQEIYQRGTVTAAMQLFPDFYNFDPKKDIYNHIVVAGETPTGGHGVCIVGWATRAGQPCWVVRNSWGPDWGIGGCFYMRRGTCDIEKYVIAPIPDFYFAAAPMQSFMDGLNFKEAVGERTILEGLKYGATAKNIDPATGYSYRAMKMYPWYIEPLPITPADFRAPKMMKNFMIFYIIIILIFCICLILV